MQSHKEVAWIAHIGIIFSLERHKYLLVTSFLGHLALGCVLSLQLLVAYYFFLLQTSLLLILFQDKFCN